MTTFMLSGTETPHIMEDSGGFDSAMHKVYASRTPKANSLLTKLTKGSMALGG